MTIDEARMRIVTSIGTIYEDDEAKNIAELIMEYVTNLPLIERIVKKNETLTPKQEEVLEQALRRLQNHEPVQYIINEAWFAEMKFYVDKNVLIPRPETEELVDWIISDFKFHLPAGKAGISDLEPNSQFQIPNSRLLDVGTGSGCIAIALKKNLPRAEVWACDISDEALNIARMNADILNTTIDFVRLNFLDREQRKQLPHIDIIVSNPPYVPHQDENKMKKNVTDYEPATALFVSDNDPLIFYDVIADFGIEKLNKGGNIYVEVHEDLGEEVKKLFQSKGYSSIELKKDLQGKDRMVKAHFD